MKSIVKSILIGVLAALALLSAAQPALGNEDASGQHQSVADEKPMALKGIMQQLAKDMSAMTTAISLEDWENVASLAIDVADHGQPPVTEKARILSFLNTEAPSFKAYDKLVHEAAVDISTAAKKHNGQQVIDAFSKVQQNCLACHQHFRDRFQAHFYQQ